MIAPARVAEGLGGYAVLRRRVWSLRDLEDAVQRGVYRIVRNRYHVLDGSGAATAGARWNSPVTTLP